ncbi:methionyl-tRNA formyltransferase [Fructobacillus sp. M1-13]|uniref:Methionyl-tRNA formyltransferase n=1 Tax=Fructobacillus papyriferae TaxID=2713171 RepID=A0ABS5QQ72_9LACO|nr:methionyl-tRNA formyltransferase [Fructobacillus papyriferae]MBS9334484.1 methionyl-tRNA formyltransferase [Fructobacillus papyriferae]MCD2158473.1 methionyl-tRNA formyltransferase [Fructobacillus papyriferae]
MALSIVFMGTPQFAVPTLEALAEDDRFDVKAVVTQPDRPFGRKRQLKASPVKKTAEKLGLRIMQPEKISGSDEMAAIINMAPDFIVTAAFGQFLPTKLLEATKYGAVNAHASLLPKYRGGAPVHYAIMNGDDKTGVSLMYMVKKMDAGDVLDVVEVPIEATDNVGTMFEKLGQAAVRLVTENLEKIVSGERQGTPQDPEQVTFSPNITREQQRVHFDQETAQQLDWHIRGLYPTHPAHATTAGDKGQSIKFVQVTPLDEKTDAKPGVITFKSKKALHVAAADGSQLSVDKLQPAGKGVMDITAFLNGAGQHLAVGDAWIAVGEANA